MSLLLFCVLVFLAPLTAAKTITIAVGSWPPFTSHSEPKARIAQQIASAAFALESIRVVYRYYPWSRCYLEAKVGHVDATLPWFFTKKRDHDFLFSKEPLIRVKDVFFHLKKLHFHWRDFADLKKYRLGGTLGYYDTELLEKHGLFVDTVPEEKLNFQKMLWGRIDAYATSLDVGNFIIHTLFSPSVAARFTHSSKPLDEANGFVLFSRRIPNGPALQRAFDQGIQQLRQSGRYQEILGDQKNSSTGIGGEDQATEKSAP